ncbi:MAG: IS66 family transposase [Kordiimonadaceae bacterium]|nr:IS66 family transposase [Kordiimonadaceae bacterium]
MTIENIDVEATITEVQKLMATDKNVSPAMKSMVSILIMLIQILVNRLGLTSCNSSKPPSTDQTGSHDKPSDDEDAGKAKKKSGGQPGHLGSTLKQVDDPDDIKPLSIDQTTLPEGDYREIGRIKRQVINVDISRWVTEYQAQTLENIKTGERFTAPFPDQVNKAVQYGAELKAHAVYMSQYQLLPYQRVQAFFEEQLGIHLSEGSLYNFNVEAYENLKEFDEYSKAHLANVTTLHVDETGININGKGHWLHCACTASWSYFFAHKNRGNLATDDVGILENYSGILCHDHWKPYYRYTNCLHSLCNAHHLRELTRAWEQDEQVWAQNMIEFLVTCNDAVQQSGGKLSEADSALHWANYRQILAAGELECPPPKAEEHKGKRGRQKRSKARNLLERLVNFEQDVLRFMDNADAPFTNNQGERDLRMTKVQQKISGCFRSPKGADMFCRIRGYLLTCRKQGMSSSEAMTLIFQKQLPDFVK